MISLLEKIPSLLRSAIFGIVAFFAGFVTNYYVDYRSSYVEALNANYEQFDNASTDIRETLRIFADIASGDKQKTDEDVSVLQTQLLAAVGKMEDLSRRLDNGFTFVRTYQNAAVNLRNAAEEVNGPLDGKVMVDAVNDFLLAENLVRDTVMQESNSFILR